MIETIKEPLIIIGVPIIRSVAGWAVKSLEDGKINTFEKKLLVSTVVRVGLIGAATYLGLNAVGIDVPVIAAAAGAYLADILIGALKGKKK